MSPVLGCGLRWELGRDALICLGQRRHSQPAVRPHRTVPNMGMEELLPFRILDRIISNEFSLLSRCLKLKYETLFRITLCKSCLPFVIVSTLSLAVSSISDQNR